jgi:hypothetical protein
MTTPKEPLKSAAKEAAVWFDGIRDILRTFAAYQGIEVKPPSSESGMDQ